MFHKEPYTNRKGLSGPVTSGRCLAMVQALTMILLAIPAMGEIIYVDASAAGANDGASWANAHVYLQDALADANASPKPIEIRVAQGVYRPDQGSSITSGDREATFRLTSDVTLEGGYAGLAESDPDQRDIALYETTLSGDLEGDDSPLPRFVLGVLGDSAWTDNSYHVVTASETDGNTVLDGFSVSGGNDNRAEPVFRDVAAYLGYGGGLAATSASLTVVNCLFRDNFAGKGGALYCREGNLTLNNCRFQYNHGHLGGGAYVQSSDGEFINCTFQANRGTQGRPGGQAAGLVCDQSRIRLTGCDFRGNLAPYWIGAIGNLNQSHAIITGCLFAGNGASYCGGLFNRDSDLAISNCTFDGNAGFAALASWSEAYPVQVKVSNCIFRGGASLFAIENRVGSTINISYSSIEGGMSRVRDLDPNGGVLWGPGSIDVDPAFAAPGYWEDPCNTPFGINDDIWTDGDYHLKSQAGRWDPISESWVQDDVTSPCIDAGDPNAPIGLEPFPNGGIVNMGAHGGTAEASKSYFGEPPCETIIAGDINGDCRVDFTDLGLLLSHWLWRGEPYEPEPVTPKVYYPPDENQPVNPDR